MRAVGGDGSGVRAAVAPPGARRRECLRVDVLAVLLEQLADVMLEGHMGLHVLGGPLVDRGHGTVRRRAAAVLLEQQVLRHRGLLVSWAAPVVAPHLVSGAGQSFSTWKHSSSLGCTRPMPQLPIRVNPPRCSAWTVSGTPAPACACSVSTTASLGVPKT